MTRSVPNQNTTGVSAQIRKAALLNTYLHKKFSCAANVTLSNNDVIASNLRKGVLGNDRKADTFRLWPSYRASPSCW